MAIQAIFYGDQVIPVIIGFRRSLFIGNAIEIDAQILDAPGGTPQNLSSFRLVFGLALKSDPTAPLVIKDTAGAGATDWNLSVDNLTAELRIDADDTGALAAGEYIFDAQFAPADGRRFPFFSGGVIFKDGVSDFS